MNPHDPNAPSHNGSITANTSQLDALSALSALADGEASAAHVAAACHAWREDPAARQTWHAYQLIGDVLRSDELARPASADVAFLSRLRTRLADEPVVLAPMPVLVREPASELAATRMQTAAASGRASSRWLVPAAVAAGFVAVAGVLVVTRINAPDSGVVEARASAPGSQAVAAATAPTTPAVTMIRSPELDAYLRAHQSARGGAAVAVPGGMLRSAEVLVPADAPR